MRICTGYQNTDIVTTAQYFKDTVEAIRHDLNNCKNKKKNMKLWLAKRGHSTLRNRSSKFNL